jgi:hypothetical protein
MYTYVKTNDGRFEIRNTFDLKHTTVDSIEQADALVWELNDLSLITHH